jgi:hypothetical protein
MAIEVMTRPLFYYMLLSGDSGSSHRSRGVN